jgi:N-sulfoglucosamine sulfohydrolase
MRECYNAFRPLSVSVYEPPAGGNDTVGSRPVQPNILIFREYAMKKPNIVFMVADDHGREALGCYGNRVIDTRNLDALAADGVRFTQSFCTTASCAASRSVMLTGLYNHANGTYGHTHSYHHFSLFPQVKTLPAYLNELGYRTACVGKKHYAPESQYPFSVEIGESKFGRNDVAMSEACRDFVNDGDTPFFLYWCSHNPHRGPQVSENHPHTPNRFGNPEADFRGDNERIYSEDEVEVPTFLTDNPATRAEVAQYYQSISRLDRGVGRLMQILKDAGKYEDTLIIYISDNGAAFPGSKTTLYEPGMNLPCIVKVPDSELTANEMVEKKGGVCNGLITWADLTPLILDFGGDAALGDSLHGRSFREIIGREQPDGWRDEVYSAHTFHEITNYYPMRVVRTDRYKFIWNIAHPLTYTFASDLWRSTTWQSVVAEQDGVLGGRSVEAYLHHPRFELFDLEQDPEELNNLAEDPEYAPMVEQFCDKIRKFQEETGDPWIHKWEYE